MAEPVSLDLVRRSKAPAPAPRPPDEPPSPPKIVHNERQKLLANALDRASTACFSVGIIGPVSAGLYELTRGGLLPSEAGPSGTFLLTVLLFAALWLTLAIVLHALARHVLGNLIE